MPILCLDCQVIVRAENWRIRHDPCVDDPLIALARDNGTYLRELCYAPTARAGITRWRRAPAACRSRSWRGRTPTPVTRPRERHQQPLIRGGAALAAQRAGPVLLPQPGLRSGDRPLDLLGMQLSEGECAMGANKEFQPVRLGIAVTCALSSMTGCGLKPDRHPYVQYALLAQVSGFGGCTMIEETRVLEKPFFPSLTFIQGRCTLEHGDIAHPVVALDQAGMVFVLDSPSAFAFMIRAHRPSVSEDELIAYATTSLTLMGELGIADTTLQPAGVPQRLLDSLGLVAGQLYRTEVRRRLGTGFEVGFTALGPNTLTTALLIVYPSSGEIRIIDVKRWRGM